MTDPFPGWLASMADEDVVVRPDDIEAEAVGNLRSLALTREQAAAVSPSGVETFARGVGDARRAWLASRRTAPMVLYWWHDEQAGHLRFSLVSESHGRLPFGCEIAPASTLAEIATSWLSSTSLFGIPWNEFKPVARDEVPPEPPTLVLPVWTCHLP